MKIIIIVLLFLTVHVFCNAQAISDSAQNASAKKPESEVKKTFSVNTSKLLQLSGYTHIRYQFFEEKTKNDGFDIRRARLNAKGAFTPSFSYRLQVDFINNPNLLDAYAEYKLNKIVIFTLGQFAVPFSLESTTPELSMESIDRSQAVEALVGRTKDIIGNQGGRDIGIQVGGSLIELNDLPLIEYKLGLFNGAGVNTSDNNNDKDVVGRLVLHPIKGINIGSSFYNGMGYYGQVPKSHIRNRFGFDIALDYAKVTFHAEYLQGKDSTTSRAGYYLQAAYYVVPKKLQLLIKYDTYDSNKDVTNNSTTYYIIGANYNITANIRLQASYSFRKEGNVKIKNNYAVIQFQIAF